MKQKKTSQRLIDSKTNDTIYDNRRRMRFCSFTSSWFLLVLLLSLTTSTTRAGVTTSNPKNSQEEEATASVQQQLRGMAASAPVVLNHGFNNNDSKDSSIDHQQHNRRLFSFWSLLFIRMFCLFVRSSSFIFKFPLRNHQSNSFSQSFSQ